MEKCLELIIGSAYIILGNVTLARLRDARRCCGRLRRITTAPSNEESRAGLTWNEHIGHI
jgi:hypothetical protein